MGINNFRNAKGRPYRDRAGGGAWGALAPPLLSGKKENKIAKNSRQISLVRHGQKLKLPLAE